MKNYKRSICSTCRHVPYCSLTSDMSNISSCSEYVHRLDEDYTQITNEPIEMFGTYGNEYDQKKLELN